MSRAAASGDRRTGRTRARLELVWADQGYTGAFARWLRDTRGWRLYVGRHPERQRWRSGSEEKPRHTFRVLSRRWVVEHPFAWLGHARRLSKDYVRLLASRVRVHDLQRGEPAEHQPAHARRRLTGGAEPVVRDFLAYAEGSQCRCCRRFCGRVPI